MQLRRRAFSPPIVISISDTPANERGPRHTKPILAAIRKAASRKSPVSFLFARHVESVGLFVRLPPALSPSLNPSSTRSIRIARLSSFPSTHWTLRPDMNRGHSTSGSGRTFSRSSAISSTRTPPKPWQANVRQEANAHKVVFRFRANTALSCALPPPRHRSSSKTAGMLPVALPEQDPAWSSGWQALLSTAFCPASAILEGLRRDLESFFVYPSTSPRRSSTEAHCGESVM